MNMEGFFCKTDNLWIIRKFADKKKTLRGPKLLGGLGCSPWAKPSRWREALVGQIGNWPKRGGWGGTVNARRGRAVMALVSSGTNQRTRRHTRLRRRGLSGDAGKGSGGTPAQQGARRTGSSWRSSGPQVREQRRPRRHGRETATTSECKF